MKWKAWVAEKVVVPLIVGNNYHDKRTKLDFYDYIWEYDGEKMPFQIESGKRKFGDMMTVVAERNMTIPQYVAAKGVGRVVDKGGSIPKERVVDFTGIAWNRVAVQTGVTATQVNRMERDEEVERMYFEIVNRGDAPVKIYKDDIVGFIQAEDSIVAAVYGESNYREIIEILKTESALSKEEGEKSSKGSG